MSAILDLGTNCHNLCRKINKFWYYVLRINMCRSWLKTLCVPKTEYNGTVNNWLNPEYNGTVNKWHNTEYNGTVNNWQCSIIVLL
jgi:hypothetical protein